MRKTTKKKLLTVKGGYYTEEDMKKELGYAPKLCLNWERSIHTTTYKCEVE